MVQISRNARIFEFVMDLVCVVLSLPVAMTIQKGLMHRSMINLGSSYGLSISLLCFLSWFCALLIAGEHRSRRQSGFLDDLWLVIRTNVLACLLFGAMVYTLKVMDVSRSFVAIYCVLICVFMLSVRYITRSFLYLIRSKGHDRRFYVVVGDTEAARRYMAQAAVYGRLGIRVIGYVAERRGVLDATYLGTPGELETILSETSCDGVVVALPLSDPNIQSVLEVCECLGKSVELVLDAFSSRITQSAVHQGPITSSLVLSSIPHTPSGAFVKRVTDVVVSAIGMLLLSPVFLVVALAIKLNDGGPIFFKQKRVGLNNKLFWMYKFRSMQLGAESLQEKLLKDNEMSGPVFKITNDPRVTAVGRFIRRTSIDELPQLFNVLRGEMSLVGPRPPLPNEVSKYQSVHRRRLSVKPGLTCLWQVSGRNNIDFEQWMDLDLLYIDNWSYMKDWAIIAKTIPAVLRRTGAR